MEKRSSAVLKIAIVGPESSGKTTLCKQLAMHFDTTYVPEFARNYLTEQNREYTLQDILLIAEKQIESEKKMLTQANTFLFCDTTLLTIKIWLKVKYNYFNAELEKDLLNHNYQLHILTMPDLPWENDPLREHPHFRSELFDMHKNYLKQNQFNYAVVSGTGEARLNKAIEEIKKLELIF